MPATSVSMCPASARSARLFAAKPPMASTAKIARVSPKTAMRRPRFAAAALWTWGIRRSGSPARRRVRQGIGEDVADVLVSERVEGDPAGLASGHGAALAQEPELMTERRDRQIQQEREIAHAEFRREREAWRIRARVGSASVSNQPAVARAASADSSRPISGRTASGCRHATSHWSIVNT